MTVEKERDGMKEGRGRRGGGGRVRTPALFNVCVCVCAECGGGAR